MATGKTNARFITIDVDDSSPAVRDITPAVKSITMPINHDQNDVTGYSDGVHNVTLGHPDQPVSMSGDFDNTASTGAHTVLSGIVGQVSATVTITVQIGIRAAPTSGDPEYEGEFFCTSYTVNPDLTWDAEFMPGSSTAPAWGTV